MDWGKLTEQVGKIKVKNVVDMPLYYGLWSLSFALIASIFTKYEWAVVVLFCFAGFCFLLAGFGYVLFAFKDPNYLRSEEYHLKRQSLEILGDKDNLLPIDGRNIVDITNPYPLNLPEGTQEIEE
jgi:hypothetical protein